MKITEPFNAVRESRKWKRNVGRKLFAMSPEEMVAYLRKSKEEHFAKLAAKRGDNAPSPAPRRARRELVPA